MADEEKFRLETPDEEVKEEQERKGFLRPLPQSETPRYVDESGRPQPIVRVLGISMREKRKDLLMLLFVPAMVGIIDTMIYSHIIIGNLPNVALYMFFIPIIIAIPIGLTASQAGNALVGAFFGAIYFVVFFIIFLSMPGIVVPELGVSNFLFSAIALSVIYFILMTLATLIGATIGIVAQEFL